MNRTWKNRLVMDMQQDKRYYRKLKQTLKRAGSKRRRRQLKRQLADHPEDAVDAQFDFGRYRSDDLNGLDEDRTRR